MEFPATVGGFQRDAIVQFSTNQRDVAVNYHLVARSGAIDATVYLMREPLLPTLGLGPDAVAAVRDSACRREFAVRLHEIAVANETGPSQQESIVLRIGTQRHAGLLARFTYQGKFAGQVRQLRSELARFCFAGAGWSVEYRFTYPADLPAAGWVADFVAGLQWTGALASA